MKIGFLVNNLSSSHLAWGLLHSCQFLSPKDDVFFFYEELSLPCVEAKAAVMPVCDSYGFDGPLIATCLGTAARLINAFTCPKRALYVWHPEWLGRTDYEFMRSVYRNERLVLLTRSESHAKLVKDCWNRTTTVIGDNDVRSFLEWAR